MSRYKWNIIKSRPGFYIRLYRMLINILLVSSVINIFLCGAIYYEYTHRKERDYYTTNGVAPPGKLKGMLTPNYSSEYLLPPDVAREDGVKEIPL